MKDADTIRDATVSELNQKLTKLDKVLELSKANDLKIQKLEEMVQHLEEVLLTENKKKKAC